MSMSNDTKTCATCRFYRETQYWGKKPFFECDGEAVSYVEASADDDSNLNYSLRPPPTFSCSGWTAKPVPQPKI